MRSEFIKTRNENGAAMVIALFVMIILMGFAALALTRATSETTISASDAAESRTFSAAEAALEDTTREFATRVESKLTLTPTDETELENRTIPYFSNNGYKFTTDISRIGTEKIVTQTKGQFQGLVSLRDEWQIQVTAREESSGVETVVRRKFFNDRIPLFQFGAFYQDDIEVNNPPVFTFNGRIHTNGNLFTNSIGYDIRYKSKITIAGELVRDIWKNGASLQTSEQKPNVYAIDTANNDKQILWTQGSVNCVQGTGGILKDNTGRNFPYPNCVTNTNWKSTISKSFEGNVVTNAPQLKLPVYKLNVPLIEMVRRSKNIGDKALFGTDVRAVATGEEDNGILSKERFANKEGLRVSLADSQDRLPQCVGKTTCGVRLDGQLGTTSSLGYQPKPMRGTPAYKTTALNGNRLAVKDREVWIKIELVKFNPDTTKPETEDVTEDILSLGVTEPVISASSPVGLLVKDYDSATDSRSIVKLQRFNMEGEFIGEPSGENYRTDYTINSRKFNFVVRQNCLLIICTDKNTFAPPIGSSETVSSDETAHYQEATINGSLTKAKIVPFPIQLQDTREGNRSNSTTNLSANTVFKNGVMSLVDIDVANLRRFYKGEFDDYFPTDSPYAKSHSNTALKAENVPNVRGWVLYFSDRRGDKNFDGRYNMEDVFPGEDVLTDEDLDNNGTIMKASNSSGEAPDDDSTVGAGYAAVTDHSYYRRGVRLINGEKLPGKYDSVTPSKTTGFTLASENGVYIWKNYNVSSVTTTSNTTSSKYIPQGTTESLPGDTSDDHIPASIVSDAVTILSNNWNDTKAFVYPNDTSKRIASPTQVRFAMIAGDPITGNSPTEGLKGKQNGGLINFKRFLENWGSKRLNYSGSLINLYNSFNNNGRHKPNGATYNPPDRDWTFEESFKNPYRLPPGTPFVYYITFTGFERVNE